MNGKIGRQRCFLYRRKRNFLAAPARPVRLGDHANDFKVGLCEEILKGGNGKLRRATEEEAH
jgi:hypothetical protein